MIDWRYRLSRLVPVRMSSVYVPDYTSSTTFWPKERATWWQWRGRIWRHRRRPFRATP